jgi:signal transduction histidine kinase
MTRHRIFSWDYLILLKKEKSTTRTGQFYLKIVVSDSGVGIDPERLKHIFEPYLQAKLSDYRMHGGTGLGLSIISSLLKLLEGASIQVESEVGKESTFTLTVPLQVSLDQGKTLKNSPLII